MTFTGKDFVLDGPTSPDEWWALMDEVRQHWPEALCRRSTEGEMAIYRDQDVFRAELSDEVPTSGKIQVLMGPERLTIVVGDVCAPTAQVGKALLATVEGLRKG